VSGVPVLDWVVTCFSVLLVAGIVWDAIGHAGGRSFAEEGFFVPSHVFFYSMFLGIVAAVFVATYRERRTGKTWVESVPDGYGYGVVGLGIFGVGGVGDYFWHRTFGFEQGFEAIVSPTHMMLAVGGVLFLSMPLRSVWVSERRVAGVAAVSVVLSAALATTIVTLFGGLFVPLVRPYPALIFGSVYRPPMDQVVAMVVAYPVALVVLAIAFVRRFRLPPLSFTTIFGVSALGVTAIEGYFALVIPALVVGLVVDLFATVRPPVPEDTRALRAFCVAVPVVFAIAYFAVVEWQYGIVHPVIEAGNGITEKWSVHVLSGSVTLAGLAGLIASYVVSPGLTGDHQRGSP
jgi:hypothetical protein